MIKPTAKFFDELSTVELYEILKARAEIFVVEQNCVYQDLDDIDYRSLHVFFQSGDRVTAYLRAFLKEPRVNEPNTNELCTNEKRERVVQMGRVLTLEHGIGLGGTLLKEGLALVKEKMNPERICIEAQCYAVGYYEREGFRVCSEEFLEDGILHVRMELQL